MYTCLHSHCVFFYEVCNGDNESDDSGLYPLYNQHFLGQFNILCWIEVMDRLLDVRQSMLELADRRRSWLVIFKIKKKKTTSPATNISGFKIFKRRCYLHPWEVWKQTQAKTIEYFLNIIIFYYYYYYYHYDCGCSV